MLKALLPPLLLLICGAVAWALTHTAPETHTQAPAREPPRVQAAPAHAQPLRLKVTSQGVVSPRTEISLVSEVPGKIVRIHPAFAAGGFFKPGEILIAIDPRDYDFAVTGAAAQVAEARKELLREQAEATQAEHEWQTLGDGHPPDAFTLHKPHLEERRAKLAAAEAALAEARLRRERCELRAPFAGRVRDKRVDVGQYVTVGTDLARLYATDTAEVRLPIAADQAGWLDLPLSHPDGGSATPGPAVTLSARFGGKLAHWQGRIVRTEGALDEKTGMLYAVAQVPEPYRYRPDRPPLAVGLFVHADIEGVERTDIFSLPQTALRAGYQVYVIDSEHRLRLRNVEVLRSDRDSVLVSGGLQDGEQVLVGGVELPVEGMRVNTESAPGGRS